MHPFPAPVALRRALTVSAACALLAGAAAPAAGAAASTAKAPRPVFVFGGFATITFDPALMASLGVTVEPRTKVKPSPQGGVRYKIVDGTTTLRHPLKGRLVTVGNLGLEQPATGRDLNFTDFTIRLTPSKSVLIARSGSNIGYGGPRQTLLRIAPPPESVVVKGAGLELRSVPVTLTAAGVTAMNQQFGGGLAAPPFALDQAVATLTVKTRWYTPGATRGRS